MNRRSFLSRAAVLPFAAKGVAIYGTGICTVPNTPLDSNAPDAAPFSAPTAQPNLDRYHLTLHRVLYGTGPAYTPDFLLEDIRATPGRRFTNFSGDVSGRWIGALSSSAVTFGGNFPELAGVVDRAIALQHPDGYFGKTFHYDHPNDDDLALLWGNGRLLVGLMEYYALKPDPAVLASARRLGDFLLRIGPSFNSQKMAEEFGAAHFASSYICWTQQTEGLAALYAATGDTHYRDLCAEISQRIVRRPGDHVHGYLCSVRGTVDLYHATGDKAHLDRAVAAWKDVMDSGDMLITGGVPEAWSPKKLRTEGCAECDWLRLNLSLYRATGEPIYLETASNVYFNEFSMNQFNTGDFGHAMLNAAGTPGIVYVRAWWCCTLHGLRAFSTVQDHVFRLAGNDVFYDLPLDGQFQSETFSAQATSKLATRGTVEIRIVKASALHTLSVRKPSWAVAVTLTRNGRSISGLRLENMKDGDIVAVQYAMSLSAEKAGDSSSLAHRQAMRFGPWLLGASAISNPGYFNELQSDNHLVLGATKPSRVKAESAFDVPAAAMTFAYIPAEFPEQPGRVALHAIAEQTATAPTNWEMAFLIRSKA